MKRSATSLSLSGSEELSTYSTPGILQQLQRMTSGFPALSLSTPTTSREEKGPLGSLAPGMSRPATCYKEEATDHRLWGAADPFFKRQFPNCICQMITWWNLSLFTMPCTSVAQTEHGQEATIQNKHLKHFTQCWKRHSPTPPIYCPHNIQLVSNPFILHHTHHTQHNHPPPPLRKSQDTPVTPPGQ